MAAFDITSVMGIVAKKLGLELYAACIQDNVAQVQVLTSDTNSTRWSTTTNPGVAADFWGSVAIAAASWEAKDVLSYCFQDPRRTGIKDSTLGWVQTYDALDTAYHFLVESNFIDINHQMDRTGTLLGVLAGAKNKRHSLMEYMLEKGAWPDQEVECEGGWYALTAASGHSDSQMVNLFLDHGAHVAGTGALILASLCGNEENVKCLLSRGADVNEMGLLSVHSSAPITSSLHKAVEYGRLGVIDILLNAGADVTLKDGAGKTAADIATERGLDETVLSKLSKGA